MAGCAIPKNPNNPTLLRQRFLIETLYLDTDIPEPMEIDLKFLNTRSKFEYSKPVYTYERSLSSFTFVKDENLDREEGDSVFFDSDGV